MRNIKLSWLGPPKIERENTTLHMETRKATALLAFLGLSTHHSSRESLAALFWPEFDQFHAHANLRRTLFSLNKKIGQGILLSTSENIGFNPDSLVWQDVTEFRLLLETVKSHNHTEVAACSVCIDTLEKAIALYRGNFLEGLNLRESPEFDNWQYLQREGFHTELVSSLENLASAYSLLGHWEKAIQKARHWVSLDHLNENAQRMLIQIYAMAGQRNAAIRQYEECSHWLCDELGQSPEEETIALYQKILSRKIEKPVEISVATTLQQQVSPAKQPIIKTKLFLPHPRPGLVSRPQLLNKLNQRTHAALTLISAPAGYGKTTLLSEWIDNLQKIKYSPPWAVCWLSLDPGDNDPTRFLTYLTAALENANPGVGKETRTILQSNQSLHSITPLSMLINNLEELPQSVLLVLDDYQFISNPAIHEGIIFLLEHMPSNVHVVIATRSDPPLPLARLRARNQLTEIRADDLRFSLIETAKFLNSVFDLSLTPEQVAILENRTEGWVAGLQLAAISMQDRLDVAQFIEAFSGSHRYIMDYLAEEALNKQPIEAQEFLLRTSILEQLSESLCDYILAVDLPLNNKDSKSTDDFSIIKRKDQGRLIKLELSNLFIVPLDEDRVWYRYHHLFADLLRTRLNQISPELIPALHIRASAWFEKNGWVEESIKHAMVAKDWENVTRLITKNVPELLENGQMATILKWFADLPQDVIFQNPLLCEQVAEVYSQAGMIDQIDPFLNKAEELISARENLEEEVYHSLTWSLSQKDVTIIRSMAAILRGLKSVCTGDPDSALGFTKLALTEFPEMEPKELAVLYWVEGWAYRSLGNLNQALDSLTRATEYALESGAIMRDTWTDLANVTRLTGKLPKAITILTNLLQTTADRGFQNQGNLSRDESFLSFIFLEQNKLDLALTHANRAIAHTQWWASHAVLATAYTSLSQILLARDDHKGSISAIQKADQARKNRLMTPVVHSLIEVTWAHIWLKQNKWELLDQWSDCLISTLNAIIDEGKSIDEYLEMRLIMLVRVWMKKKEIDKNTKRHDDCLHLLVLLKKCSQTAGRINSLVEILFLKAAILYLEGNNNEALDYLEECFSKSEPGGYMRIFLDTGEPARSLISAYLQKPKPIYKTYALQILKSFGGYVPKSAGKKEYSEALTSREMEVLHLLVEGFSNRQMAENLIVSEGTIKFHVHQILSKLQVKSRTQAIARARDLELI